MQQFDNNVGKRRRIDLCVMKASETEDYFLQFVSMDAEKKKKKAAMLSKKLADNAADVKQWYLAVKDKSGQIIGKIEVQPAAEDEAWFTIEIPNEQWIQKYGDDAVDQFVKICKEKEYFSVIRFDENNRIIEHYRRLRGIQSTELKIA